MHESRETSGVPRSSGERGRSGRLSPFRMSKSMNVAPLTFSYSQPAGRNEWELGQHGPIEGRCWQPAFRLCSDAQNSPITFCRRTTQAIEVELNERVWTIS